jgi:amino acid transporter
MTNSITIITLIAFLIVVLGVFFIAKNRGDKTEPDYRVFFILGITWLPLGISTDNAALLAMGVVFMVMGLANRDKWKEQEKWSELSPEKKKIKLIIILGLTVLLLLGIAAYFFANNI